MLALSFAIASTNRLVKLELYTSKRFNCVSLGGQSMPMCRLNDGTVARNCIDKHTGKVRIIYL